VTEKAKATGASSVMLPPRNEQPAGPEVTLEPLIPAALPTQISQRKRSGLSPKETREKREEKSGEEG
jgi:hypothetical protein